MGVQKSGFFSFFDQKWVKNRPNRKIFFRKRIIFSRRIQWKNFHSSRDPRKKVKKIISRTLPTIFFKIHSVVYFFMRNKMYMSLYARVGTPWALQAKNRKKTRFLTFEAPVLAGYWFWRVSLFWAIVHEGISFLLKKNSCRSDN